jgi:hypothetical protein
MSQTELSEVRGNGHLAETAPDPKVPPRAKRRHFSPEYPGRGLCGPSGTICERSAKVSTVADGRLD